uniref:uncharacterized protein LOC118142810 isoform X2 n=1 Tax=Callithrix jacchus TaxID=9483 RepID=UPI00159E282A|nr:uncharacterized protein LOC118142810 isoform X2 [Callithrix jacchus]
MLETPALAGSARSARAAAGGRARHPHTHLPALPPRARAPRFGRRLRGPCSASPASEETRQGAEEIRRRLSQLAPEPSASPRSSPVLLRTRAASLRANFRGQGRREKRIIFGTLNSIQKNCTADL